MWPAADLTLPPSLLQVDIWVKCEERKRGSERNGGDGATAKNMVRVHLLRLARASQNARCDYR